MIVFVNNSLWVSLLSVTLTLFAGLPTGAAGQEAGWEVYRDSAAGFEISYPSTWNAVVARQRSSPGVTWEPEVLVEGELRKVTFNEIEEDFWPGRYQVRVLENPTGLDLEEVYSQFDLTDLWAEGSGDTVVAGLEAKTWIRWQYDSLGREYLLALPDRVFHLLHDEHNGNDPNFDVHHDMYVEMTESFKVLAGEQ